MENSKIAWTDHTFNPWIGCTKVSPGCEHCYAESLMDHRYKKVSWGKGNPRKLTKTWGDPIKWEKEAVKTGIRKKVFCASLADVFDVEVHDSWRDKLFELIEKTPHLDWLILTKRTWYMRHYLNARYKTPLPNVWVGTSVEDQQRLNKRLEDLLETRAFIHWLSVEPQIELIDFYESQYFKRLTGIFPWGVQRIDWVICGGESGSEARPFFIEWARIIKKQCQQMGVSFFMKQMGSNLIAPGFERNLIKASKGDNMDEWPEDLRVREFPQ